MRISDWSSDVCSSDLAVAPAFARVLPATDGGPPSKEKGRCLAAPPFSFSLEPGRRTGRNLRTELLQFDGRAGSFELLLQLFGFRLAGAFLDGLRCAFDERLGFAKTQSGDRAAFLDAVDLLSAVTRQDDVDFGLLFSRLASIGGSRGGRNTKAR